MERRASLKQQAAAPAAAAAPPPASSPDQQQQQQQLPVLHSVLEYEKLHRIGEGTYGVVYKARHIPTGEIVALKKVRFDRSRDGVPVTSVRELAILQAARHPNIVRLLRVVTGSRADSVFLVFEYADHDLGRLLDRHVSVPPPSVPSASVPSPSGPPASAAAGSAFSEAEVKTLFRQLLAAVAHLHGRWVLHRDLKLSNLLYSDGGLLKLCDFGLARHFHPGMGRLTPRVVTLWYRAPELLLGADAYDAAIDCWALGCILGELLKGGPLFPASSEAECVHMHCQLLGTPAPRIWPGMQELPLAATVRWPVQPYNLLRRSFPELSPAGLALLNGLLTYDPRQRLSAAAALRSEYFRERPYPRRQADMPSFPASHGPSSHHHGSAAAAAAAGPSSAAAAAAGGGSQAYQRHQRFGAAFDTSSGGSGSSRKRDSAGAMQQQQRWQLQQEQQQQQHYERYALPEGDVDADAALAAAEEAAKRHRY